MLTLKHIASWQRLMTIDKALPDIPYSMPAAYCQKLHCEGLLLPCHSESQNVPQTAGLAVV